LLSNVIRARRVDEFVGVSTRFAVSNVVRLEARLLPPSKW